MTQKVLQNTFAHVLKKYFGDDMYNKLHQDHMDISDCVEKSKEGINLLVGGDIDTLPPQYKIEPFPCWETLDPYCPNDVTYRDKLESTNFRHTFKNRFSLVHIPAVFEHIHPLHLYDCMQTLKAIVKPKGLVFISIPFVWAYHPSDSRYNFGGDYLRFTPQGVEALFDKSVWKKLKELIFVPKECPDGIGIEMLFEKIV